jgi:hypothetical protein
MRRVELLSGDIPPRTKIWEMLKEEGMYLAQDCVVRDICNGIPVSGGMLTRVLSGPVGIVPNHGEKTISVRRERAEDIILAFHELFSSPVTFRLQVEYGKEHFVKSAHRTKVRVGGRNIFIHDVVYGENDISRVRVFKRMRSDIDLAMCMYWSNSVNAPGAAKRRLGGVLRGLGTVPVWSEQFARELILSLGNTTFGRWDDDIKHGRYQRTRRVAMRSGLWPEELFEGPRAIMPEDLPG